MKSFSTMVLIRIIQTFSIELKKLLFFLPTITDRKEKINQYLDNISLHPVDITQAEFKELSKNPLGFELQNFETLGEKKKVSRECFKTYDKSIKLKSVEQSRWVDCQYGGLLSC